MPGDRPPPAGADPAPIGRRGSGAPDWSESGPDRSSRHGIGPQFGGNPPAIGARSGGGPASGRATGRRPGTRRMRMSDPAARIPGWREWVGSGRCWWR
jgi:hypothetical protein